MPGAPNKPPERSPTAPTPPAPDEPRARLLRRLAPARVALHLDLWKGAPHPDLLVPFERAEAAFERGDWVAAESALDQLSVRFHEPRWPTLPEPFRSLRVAIPAPQPPSWDPDHALSPEERAARKARREAELQLALARATLDWLKSKGHSTDALTGPIATAEAGLSGDGVDPTFYSEGVDRIWQYVRAELPPPKGAATRAPAAPPAAEADAGAG